MQHYFNCYQGSRPKMGSHLFEACFVYLVMALFGVSMLVNFLQASSEESSFCPEISVQQYDPVISSATFDAYARLIIGCLPTRGLVKIWDAQRQRLCRQVLAVPYALAAALSPNCYDVFVGTQRGKLFLIDRHSGAQHELSLPLKDAAISTLVLSADGNVVYSGSNVRHDNVTSIDIRQSRYKVTSTLSGHSDSITSMALNGLLLVTGSFDSTALVWDIRYLKPLHHFKEHQWGVLAAAVQACGDKILTGSVDKECLIWSLGKPDSGTVVNGTTWITAGALSGDGLWAAVGQQDGLIILVQLNDLHLIPVIRMETMVRSLEFSSDNQRLLACSYGNVLVFSLAKLMRERL